MLPVSCSAFDASGNAMPSHVMNDRRGEQNKAERRLASFYQEHLCDTCQDLFGAEGAYAKLSSKKGIVVHRPRLALEFTARNGCWLCRQITEYQDVSEDAGKETKDLSGSATDQNSAGVTYIIKFLSLFASKNPVVTTAFRYNPTIPYAIRCTRSQWWHKSKDLGFQVFTNRDNPAAQHISSRSMNRSFSDQQIYKDIRQWAENCSSTHTNCRALNPALSINFRPPSRLIDVSGKDTVRLYSPLSGADPKYAALSYCWGKNQSNVLTGKTETRYKDGINIKLLPLTLRHAVQVTRLLELDYLWVDSLCILQDSPMDMAHEIGRMDSIYSNAFLTISASCVSCCDDSILHDRDFSWDSSQLLFRCDNGQSGEITLATSGNKAVHAAESHSNAKDHLTSRAWAFQENFLSRRMLIFSQYQLFWVCREVWDSNGGHTTRDQYFSNTEVSCRVRAKVNFTDWIAAAEEYSTKNLSVPSDKLPALSSIASYFSQQLNDTYVAGFWLTQLPYQLCWAATGGNFPSTHDNSYVHSRWQRPVHWRAPSWSYLSVDARIKFHSYWRTMQYWKEKRYDEHETSSCCSVINVDVEPMFETAKFGRIKDNTASLKLRGRLWRFQAKRGGSSSKAAFTTHHIFRPHDLGTSERKKSSSQYTRAAGMLWYDTMNNRTRDMVEKVATCYEVSLDPEGLVWCIPLFKEQFKKHIQMEDGPDSELHYWGLVLSRLPDGRYHRIGIFDRTDNNFGMGLFAEIKSSEFGKAPEQIIEII